MKEKKKVDFKGFFKYLKFINRYAKNGKKYLFFIFLICLLATGMSIVIPVLSAQMLVKITNSLWEELFLVIAIMFVVEIIRNITRNIDNYFCNKFYYDVRKNLQLDLVSETLKITNDDMNNNSSGVFIDRINSDTVTVTDMYLNLIDVVTELIGGIGVCLSILFINYIMFFVYIASVFIMFLLEKRLANIMFKKDKELKKVNEKIIGFTSEIVRGSKDIKILNAENSFIKKTKSLINNANKQAYVRNRTRSNLKMLNASVWDILNTASMIICALIYMKGFITLAAALIIINYRDRIMSLSFVVEHLFEQVKSFELAASRIYEILEGSEFTKESFGTKKIKNVKGNIEFKNVSFEYDENSKVLKNMSFNIPENKTVAFVGKSGSGKSTIFNLISSLYKTNEGEILLDGIPLNELDKDSIRGNLSIISQNPYIYNLSIRENLQIIKSDATEEEIVKACKMACLHDFIISLKNGYDTVVGEGGVTLSGGQKQRLAIARAFLLGTKIILFDEATSALDNETQSNIQRAIANMKGDFTVLIIAHRLSTVASADTIFVVDNGRIIDSGSQSELLRTSRTFKKLYDTELQS